MVAHRILTAVLGVLAIAAGCFCLLWPGMTYVALVWMIGIVLVVNGIANIVSWPDRKTLGLADGWSLAGAIISIVFGFVLLGSNLMQVVMDIFVAYMVAAWLLAYGIIRVVMALKIRSARKALDARPGTIGSRWGWVLFIGIVMVVCGVIGFFNPLSLMLALGVMVGVSVIVLGVDLVVMAIVA